MRYLKEKVKEKKGIIIPFKNGVLIQNSSGKRGGLPSSELSINKSETTSNNNSTFTVNESETLSFEKFKELSSINYTFQSESDTFSRDIDYKNKAACGIEDLKKNNNPTPSFLIPDSTLSIDVTDFETFDKHKKNFEFEEHSKENYITHKMEVDYDTDSVLKRSPMESFLKTITKNLKLNLAILRALLYCIVLNKIDVQLGLYLFGPGGYGENYFYKYSSLYLRS